MMFLSPERAAEFFRVSGERFFTDCPFPCGAKFFAELSLMPPLIRRIIDTRTINMTRKPMKIAVVIIRTLMGLLFLFSSIVVLFKLVPQPELKGGVGIFMEGMEASVYLLPLLKVTELLCAIAFISGRFVPLATVVIFPITLNILLFHIFLAPEGLPVAILLFLANLFLAYACRKNYETLWVAK